MASSPTPKGVTMTSRVNGEREKTPYDLCLDQIYELKSKVETAAYGKNKASVRDAIKEQTLLQQSIEDYSKSVDDMLEKTEDEVQKQGLKDAFQKLKDVSQQKLTCLNTMLEISTLEEHCSALGETFDRRAVQLVDPENRGKELTVQGENNQGFMSPSSQDCVFAAEDNWTWLSTLMKCLETHLKNGAQYQQFFHECDESSVWMLEDLKRLHDVFEISPLKGDYQDAERLTQELTDITVALRQWEVKTDYLWEQARRIVPVQQRTSPTKEPLPARALCNYETKQGKIREHEDLLVIDSTDSQQWVVRNARGQEFSVPALTILIPGPFKDAIEAAVRMRLQLLAAWTNTLKRVGQRLITFMLLVFKNNYQEDEIKTLRSIPMVERSDLGRVLDFVEDTLKVHWSEHQGFQSLQERVLMLRMMLEEAEDKETDEESYKSLVVQILVLEKLMQKYQDLWREWETYKTALEASRAPELMLIVDKWEQLKFVSRDYFTKFWQNTLPLDDLNTLTITDITEEAEGGSYGEGSYGEGVIITEGSSSGTTHEGSSGEGVIITEGSSSGTTHEGSSGEGVIITEGSSSGKTHEGSSGEGVIIQEQAITAESSSFEEGMFEERIEETTTSFTQATAAVDEVEGSEFGMATERKTAETEQLTKGEREETKKFVIQSVMNTETDTEVSLDEAIMAGIINPQEGIYHNKLTGETYPIPVAMGAGLIKVAFTTTKRTQEKKSSIGIITVKTIKETVRPYKVKGVKDMKTNEVVSKEEAANRGILDEAHGTFLDKANRKKLLMADAIDKGFIEVEYEGEAEEPEVIAQTYAIRAVVDTRQKKTITFGESVRRGIISRENGSFRDTATGESMYVGDAIMRGFLKARKIDDPSSMDIDPENKMIIDKTEKIRQKILRPLRVLGAFKKAAMLASNNK